MFEELRVYFCACAPLEVFVVGDEHETEASDDEAGEVLPVIDGFTRLLWLLFFGLFEEVKSFIAWQFVLVARLELLLLVLELLPDLVGIVLTIWPQCLLLVGLALRRFALLFLLLGFEGLGLPQDWRIVIVV